MYAHVRVPIGEPIRSMLVPDSAFGSDQGIRFLYLIGPENKAIRVDATVGLQEGELRVVESVQVPGKASPARSPPRTRLSSTGCNASARACCRSEGQTVVGGPPGLPLNWQAGRPARQ